MSPFGRKKVSKVAKEALKEFINDEFYIEFLEV